MVELLSVCGKKNIEEGFEHGFVDSLFGSEMD